MVEKLRHGQQPSKDILDESARSRNPNPLPTSPMTTTTRATDTSSTWAGDSIPQEHLEQLRKRFSLTREQMKRVMDVSRRQAMTGRLDDDPSFWTPHQQLNALVYTILFFLFVYFVNRDYGNLATIWFAQNFPNEAATLGIDLGATS